MSQIVVDDVSKRFRLYTSRANSLKERFTARRFARYEDFWALRDVSYLVGIGMQILFYSTPIVYQLTDIPEKIGPVPVRALVEASPLTQYVIQSRQVMYLLESPLVRQIGYTFACSVIVLLFGWWVFSRRAADVIEEI